MKVAFEYAKNGDTIHLSELLKNGMDIKYCSEDKSNLLYYSILGNQINTTQFLIDNKIEINSKNEKGISPIHIAFENGNKEIVSLLLLHNANIFIKDNILLANFLFTKHNKSNILSLLSTIEFPNELFDDSGFSPIHCACEFDSVDFLKAYLNIKSNFIYPDVSLPQSWAPLHIAILKNNTNSAHILIDDYHANVNVTGKNNSTPLHVASQLADDSMVAFLLEKGANPNSPDSDFNSPLMKSIQSNNFKAVKSLIQANADLTLANKNKSTPLHFACRYGSKEIVELLLSLNLNVNAIDNTDSTPLFYAVSRQDPIIVKMLVDKGADPLMRNIDGKSVLSLAKSNEIISILRGAVSNSEVFKKRKEVADKIENDSKPDNSNDNIMNDDLIKLDFSSSDDNEDDIFRRNDQIDEYQFMELEQEEEEEEEEYMDENEEFLEFKENIESKIFQMQSSMATQLSEMIKMIKTLIQKKNEMTKMLENKKKQKNQT